MVTGHLVSLHLALEQGLSGKAATRAIGQILKHAEQFTWLAPPTPNGRITVLDVVKARSLPEHEQLVLGWRQDVWQAWAPHTPWAQTGSAILDVGRFNHTHIQY